MAVVTTTGTVVGTPGDDTLYGATGDWVRGGAGNDLIIGGTRLTGAEGNDILDSTKSTTTVLAEGGVGKDLIRAGATNDYLRGGDGNDIIRGGLGSDTLTGGSGDDVFRYKTVDFTTGAAADKILDFGNGADKLQIEGFTFGTSAIIGNGTNTIGFDTTGDGVADLEISFATKLTLTGGDFKTFVK